MRIRMFSLCSERDLSQRKLEAKIADALHGFASNEIEFEDFSEPAEMLAPLAESLKNEALTVVAVEKPIYNKIKKKLLPAMGYILDEDATVRAMVSDNSDLDEKKITSHSLFPEGAKIFPSVDGMFSAFSVQKGSKLFIMLPLDKNRVDALLNNEIIPYLVGLFGEPVNEDAPPAPKKEKAVFSDPLVRSVNLLKEANASVAFCANKQEEIIDAVIKRIEGSDDLFVFAPHVEDRGDIDVVSYSVQLARAAKNLSHTELGAVISDPFDDDNGRGVCISITDGEKAIARRFYAEDGEEDESLVTAATEEAITLLGQNAYGVLSENAIGTDNIVHEKVAEKKTVKIILITLIIILVLCLGAGIVFKILDGRGKKEPTTEPSTQPTTVTTTEKKVVEPAEIKNLMVHIVDLIKDKEEHQVRMSDNAPDKFTRNGEEMDARDALALIVQNAINDEDDWNEEALKAMAVVMFTNLKYRDNDFDISDVEIANTADAEVKQAVDAVYGEYLAFEKYVIAAPFTRYSAGKTASAESVYGVDLPYLVSVDVDSDKRTDDYKYDVTISSTELSSIVYKATSENLAEVSNDPKTWIKIESQDKAFDGDSGYVEKITVGKEIISGYDFAQMVNSNSENKIASVCFDVSYNATNKEFVFTCYGFGSGVGLSQRGAIRMARRENATYDDILAYFYKGAELIGVEDEEEETEEASSTEKPSESENESTTESTTKKQD